MKQLSSSFKLLISSAFIFLTSNVYAVKSGPYVDLKLGYSDISGIGSTESTSLDNPNDIVITTSSNRSIVVGGNVGYNWEWRQTPYLTGVEFGLQDYGSFDQEITYIGQDTVTETPGIWAINLMGTAYYRHDPLQHRRTRLQRNQHRTIYYGFAKAGVQFQSISSSALVEDNIDSNAFIEGGFRKVAPILEIGAGAELTRNLDAYISYSYVFGDSIDKAVINDSNNALAIHNISIGLKLAL